MNNQLPSLITVDAQSGLVLAGKLADELKLQLEQGTTTLTRPGGTNYLLPAAMPKELVGSILFYAIACANQGWMSRSA